MADIKMIDYALKYARMGLRIHPCNAKDKTPYIKAMAEAKAKAEGRTLSNYIEQLIIRDNEESR